MRRDMQTGRGESWIWNVESGIVNRGIHRGIAIEWPQNFPCGTPFLGGQSWNKIVERAKYCR